jgi:RNA polymerase-binding transcription factor DksA
MVATTVRYSDEDLHEFKVLITEKLEAARKEVGFLREQMLEINENSANQQSGDWTDESSSHTEMEMLNNMLARQQQFIRNLENAMIRIQNKTYGVCILTGQLISKERLKLVPHATKSVEAKNARPIPNTATHAVADPTARRRTDDETPIPENDEAAEITTEYYGTTE